MEKIVLVALRRRNTISAVAIITLFHLFLVTPKRIVFPYDVRRLNLRPEAGGSFPAIKAMARCGLANVTYVYAYFGLLCHRVRRSFHGCVKAPPVSVDYFLILTRSFLEIIS